MRRASRPSWPWRTWTPSVRPTARWSETTSKTTSRSQSRAAHEWFVRIGVEGPEIAMHCPAVHGVVLSQARGRDVQAQRGGSLRVGGRVRQEAQAAAAGGDAGADLPGLQAD